MKDTAVQWLWDKLLKAEFINDPEELLNQAKEMEEKQMTIKKCFHPLTERKHTSDIHFECTICGYNNY